MIRRLLAGVCLAAGAVVPAVVPSGAAQAQTAPTLPASLAQRLQACATCHGSDGNAVAPQVPSLAAQPQLFLENQLVVIRDGLREIPQMKGLLDGIGDDEVGKIAAFYAQMPARPEPIVADEAKLKRGAELSTRGLCGTCHLPDYRGREQMPRLAGQREDFLLASMRQFRAGQTKGRDTMMSSVLYGLSDADLSDLAHFLATRR